MLNFAAGVEPLPSRIILWSDTYLEHEKANHNDVIKNHPFNYRLEIVVNHSTKSIVNYSDALPEEQCTNEKNNQNIQQLLDMCTKFKENSTLYICSNVQPIDIISFVQDETLKSDYLIYCHTLGANSDSMSSNQMAIYPIFNKSETCEISHHLRFRFDKDTLLEMGLQRTEKNKANSKKTSANSAQFESDNYSTVSYNLPFKNNSKKYERLKWALNKEETNPIHCYFGIYSIQNNCWICLDNFEKCFSDNSKIKKISGKEFFNVRVLKEENLLLPQVDISLTEVLNNKSTSTSSGSNNREPSQSYCVMDENSDEEVDDEIDEEEDYINTNFFTKVQTIEEEKELLKKQTAKALLNCVGLLSGGMANDFIGSLNKEQQPINDSPEEIISQKNSLIFSNSLTEDVSFSRVDQTFIIKLEGILPPLLINSIFEKIWKNMTVNDKCYNLILVTGMEDSVVSWKNFNHTYSISGENDYLYVIFPPRKCSNEQLVTPNWLLQMLNQQDEFS